MGVDIDTNADNNLIDNMLDKAKKKLLDVNNDGKIDFDDLTVTIKLLKEGNWKTILSIVVGIVFYFIKGDIIDLINSSAPISSWWDFILNTILVALIVGLFNWIAGMSDKKVESLEYLIKQKDDDIVKLKDDNMKLKFDLKKLDYDKNIELSTKDQKHEIELKTIEAALDTKTKYIELIADGLLKPEAMKKQ